MTEPAESRMRIEDEARVAATAKAFRARAPAGCSCCAASCRWLILMLAGGTISWVVLRSVMSDVERKAGTSREIRLDALRFHGQDAEGRSFVIGADGAVRDPDTGRYRLIGPALRLNLGGPQGDHPDRRRRRL
jgi:lipopolysaccharide export system protein LptC